MKVGCIGLGDQGAPMAEAIAAAGHEVVLWARRRETLEALAGRFEHEAVASVPELGARCDLVAVCVDRDEDVEELLLERGLLVAMRPGSVLVNHGTGSPGAARRFAAWGRDRAVGVLDAPVSGGAAGAEARTLTVMVGGGSEPFARALPVFESFAGLVRLLGPAGSGQLAKVLNNTLLALNLRSSHAILDLAARLGVDLEPFVDLVLASSGRSMALQQLGTQPRDLLLHFQGMLHKDVTALEDALVAASVDPADAVSTARGGIDAIPGACDLLEAARGARTP